MAVQAAPAEVGIALANWNWKVVRQFIAARSGHMIHRDQPEVVVAAIREVVEAVRRGARPYTEAQVKPTWGMG